MLAARLLQRAAHFFYPRFGSHMPKKYKKIQYDKPRGVVHPALSSSSVATKDGSSTLPPSSVNDLIQELRRSQAPPSTDRVHDDANAPTVHPSLRAILQLPDTLPPRPRLGTRVLGGRRTRGPAGPPPPTSWLIDSIYAPEHLQSAQKFGKGSDYIGSKRLDRLPGLFLPEANSLLHQVLKAIAKDWRWHVEYDQFYLATLPGRCKEALLSYIATYGSSGVTLGGLETLFFDETELEGATGSDTITHLDLGSAISPSLTLRDFNTYLTKKTSGRDFTNSSAPVPDSWDSIPTTFPVGPISLHRFPFLTHLSLSHASSPSWRVLLASTPHLQLLTHLSLAYWPTPSLTPNSRTASTVSPQGKALPYGGSTIYSHTLDSEWSEAVSILRRLAKGTLCLKWLDLEGCSSWLEALAWSEEHVSETTSNSNTEPQNTTCESEDTFSTGFGIPWLSHWRSLTTIRTAQPSFPPSLLTPSAGWEDVLKHSTLVALGSDNADEKAYSTRRMERNQLLEWLRTERKIEGVVKKVKEISRRRGGKGVEVSFERGWDDQEWEWVRKAMRVVEQGEVRWGG